MTGFSRHISGKFNKIPQGLILDTGALASYDDVIDLSIGDPDLTTDAAVIDAAMRDAKAGYTRYGDPAGDPQLIRAVCRDWRLRQGMELDPSMVQITCSAGLAMMMSLIAVTDPGDEVIVLSPHYPEYSGQIAMAGAVEREVALSSEEGFAITAEKLEAAVTSRTKALIFNNPVNPTGGHYREDTLKLLLDFAKSHDLVILADEIYTDLVYDGPFRSILALPGAMDCAVSIGSFSKNFMMTGWRVGFIAADPALLDVILRISDWMTYCAPSVSQRAALAALNDAERLRGLYVPVFRERVMAGAEKLAQCPTIDIARPQGTFYLFPSIKRSGMTSQEYCAWLLKEKHILATPGSLFGKGGEGCVRFACTVPAEKLTEAFGRL
ncbi:MAG: aminotransferase class I/II-fold pyridoxal phosphate-dependent enzyme [Firmicutes bacterium]|nr:aminotransferase class I/II-fold pyridoxal phosphate-dependent enzyme [Bacillota bacterium]MBR0115593.1 aminotransferase class I/II-fold pyridoxal phosphate-dependent enzyme [Bacillota bacterium]MBR0441625.1 aminotransferase class I/II-fold pyridoxal phosphate-dependent enzyme [Bacillota bacterium]